MFRYIALAWDSAAALHGTTAERLQQNLVPRLGWRAELTRPGLHVYTTGSRDRANGAYPIQPDAGVVVGKLFCRADLELGACPDAVLSASESARILDTGGRALIDDYWGRYVAFMQDRQGRSHALRDPSGALPSFRMEHEGVTIVFSWLDDVLATMPWVPPPRPNPQAIAAHILFTKLGGRDTALDGVSRVLPGERCELAPTASDPVLLWNVATIAREPMRIAPAEAAPLLRRTVQACARTWANCHDQVLQRLSGGVDSSILVSCLSGAATRTEVTCLNYHSPGADSDEREYARLAAARAGRPLVERERDRSFRLERTLDVAHTPTPANYAGRMGTAEVDAALAAELGATAMLTGAGGDQLFFELRCCWPAADYLRVRGPDAGFATAAMDAARLGRVSVWAALRQAIADRFHEADAWADIGQHLRLVRREALPTAAQRDRYVHPALLPGHGLPIGKLSQALQLVHPLDYYDPYLREAAPELINPLLSQPLIELCLRLPTFVLTFGGRGRALARHAFADDLPPEIARRRSKGGMEEHMNAVMQRNADFARSLLLDGELVRMGILDRTLLEHALGGSGGALSQVNEIHVYVGIEAWIQRWKRRRSSPPDRPAEAGSHA